MRVPDGRPDCQTAGISANTLGFLWDDADKSYAAYLAVLDPSSRALRPLAGNYVFKLSSLGTSSTAWDSGLLMAFGARVDVADGLSASPPKTVLTAPGGIYGAAARGQHVFFMNLYGHTLYSFLPPSTPPEIVLSGGDLIDSYDIAPDKLVWLTGHGPKQNSFVYTSADVTWSPVPTHASDLVPSKPITVPITSVASDLAAYGDYAAMSKCGPDPKICDLLVVQLSTGKQWEIPNAPGWNLVKVFAVGPDEVLVGRQLTSANPHIMQQIWFYRLDSLDGFAK